ncbi:MAG: sugar kinase [Actinobacteria bacterium]|nr:sugar kinase [Actinomycetota bacterium]
MSLVELRPVSDCRYDLVALGEVMLRLDPGDGRIATARTFAASEGGGEYNVARGLRRCFGLRTGIVTALADNPIGRLIEDLMLQGGVEQAHLQWAPYDGVGREIRNGLNFTERGFGVRGALGCSDRGRSAASALKPGDVDWEALFGRDGVRWFHCGGVFGALSAMSAEVALEAMAAARAHGTVVSFDLNYRASLWQALGGEEAAAVVNRRLVEQVDVLLGNEEDFSAALGFQIQGLNASLTGLEVDAYRALHARIVDAYPRLALVATTLREAHTATRNDWNAVASTRESFAVGPGMTDLEIFDRVGGGDSFAAGLVYGLLQGFDVDTSLAYGIAHGALAMTTPGDTSMATLKEVGRLVAGGSARVAR